VANAVKEIIWSSVTPRQPIAMLKTGRCHITLSPVKNTPAAIWPYLLTLYRKIWHSI